MLDYAAESRIGKREKNEDTVLALERGGNYIFVVADGLGGHIHGDLASKRAAEVFAEEFRAMDSAESSCIDFLQKSFTRAAAEILALQKETGAPLKTTACCLAVLNGKLAWGHIGDSRVYQLKKRLLGWRLARRTLDHSVPQKLAAAGIIKEKDIAAHPDRALITRVLGAKAEPGGESSTYHEISKDFPLRPGYGYLLCTDGLWEHVRAALLPARGATAESWLAALFAEAEKSGEASDLDNYSAVAVLCK